MKYNYLVNCSQSSFLYFPSLRPSAFALVYFGESIPETFWGKKKTLLLLKASFSVFFLNPIGFHCQSYSICFLTSAKFLIDVIVKFFQSTSEAVDLFLCVFCHFYWHIFIDSFWTITRFFQYIVSEYPYFNCVYCAPLLIHIFSLHSTFRQWAKDDFHRRKMRFYSSRQNFILK